MNYFLFRSETEAKHARERHIRLRWTAFSVFKTKDGLWAFWSNAPFNY